MNLTRILKELSLKQYTGSLVLLACIFMGNHLASKIVDEPMENNRRVVFAIEVTRSDVTPLGDTTMLMQPKSLYIKGSYYVAEMDTGLYTFHSDSLVRIRIYETFIFD